MRAPAPTHARFALRAALALAAIALVLGLGLGLAVRAVYAGDVLPATRVGGVEIGGASPALARARLAEAYAADRAVTLTHRDERFRVIAADAGYVVDVDATVARARRAGRDGPLGGIFSTLPSLLRGRQVEPVVRLDRRALRRAVGRIAEDVDRPVFAGALAIDGGGTDVGAEAPRDGRRLDVRRTSELLVAALRRPGSASVQLPVRVAPAPSAADVEAVADQARRYLASPLLLSGGDEPIDVDREQLAALLILRPTAAGGVRLGVRATGTDRLVDELAERLNREPVNAAIRPEPRTVTVDGKLDVSWRPRRVDVEVGDARGGRALRRDAARRAIAAAVRDGSHEAQLDVERADPRVSTADARRVASLIGTFTTSYACCEPRTQNIRRMARAIDGTIISPGEQFSLNAVAGPRTREKGYVEAPFIAEGNELMPSIGGGVSQVSTTVYNAAYFAGLPLDRHQAHSLFIDRYPAGRESTLNFPSIDLAWTNDTDAPILVRASTSETSVAVSLYGDNGRRRVQAQPGPRLARPAGGFTITVTRRIRYRGGRTTRVPTTTTYVEPPA